MRRRHWFPFVCAALLVPALAALALAGEYHQDFTFDQDRLQVNNMIGRIVVREGSGDQFKVAVDVRGDDANADILELVTTDEDGDILTIKFPVDDHDKYIYPELGGNSKTTITYRGHREHGGSWLRKIIRTPGDKITIRGKGSGLEVWADVTIEVPEGHSLKVRHGVGTIEASGARADLDLDTHSGPIEVADVKGDLRCDTGSGRVTVADIEGEILIDTGSGKVKIDRCDGPQISVDTGSGRVDAADIDCNKLHIDTGSGAVTAKRIACDRAKIDTGSGSVELELDRMGEGRFVIDTGSGSIDLVLPDDASARIVADTGSGKVRNQVQGAMVERMSRDEMRIRVGDGGAEVILDAGSGSITVSQK